jgi:4-hydroxyacetophenone monooxygenase
MQDAALVQNSILGTSIRTELLEASDEEIRDAIEFADPMVLRGLLYQLTGDESLASIRLESMDGGRKYAVPGIAEASDVELIKAKAVAYLKSYRDAGAGAIEFGVAERLQRSLGFTAGVEMPNEDLEQWREELGLDPWARGLDWQIQPAPSVLEEFEVVVIGAGMGGLNAAVQLKHAGIKYTLFEKDAEVGGTWYENHYPGARLDTESRSYTHLYGAYFGYAARFNEWAENERYFNWVADAFELREDIAFNTEVISLIWDDEASNWVVTTEGPHGRRVSRANAVISAVGILNRPTIPEIVGATDFKGQTWHTARWPEGRDLNGKKVAVIGSACTAYQMVPELALDVEHLYLFQRTPQWQFPVGDYRSQFAPQVTWLDRNFPYYVNFLRFRVCSLTVYALGGTLDIDPDFKDPHSPSLVVKEKRDECIAFLERKFESRPDLLEKMIPAHPPYTARPVVVDEGYGIADALLRDNVTLVTDGIEQMNETGIVSNDGSHYDVDVIVYATGFKPNENLWPMEVRGRDGLRVEELWAKTGPQAYLGAMVPDFPNFFMIFGPNTAGGLPIAASEELITRYALECLERLISDGGKGSIEVTEEAYRSYNEETDRRNEKKVWSDPRATSGYYYLREFGRSARCPYDGTELWQFLRHPNFDELIVKS